MRILNIAHCIPSYQLDADEATRMMLMRVLYDGAAGVINR